MDTNTTDFWGKYIISVMPGKKNMFRSRRVEYHEVILMQEKIVTFLIPI